MPVTVHTQTYENRWQRSMFSTARKAIVKAVTIGNKRFKENISLTCHSLEELRDMDHPYAARHGSHGRPIHLPYWKVHKQSGGLLASGVMNPIVIETADSVVGNFGFKPDPLPMMLVGGTSKMIPRPVVAGSLSQMKKPITDIIVEAFRNRYSGNVGIE